MDVRNVWLLLGMFLTALAVLLLELLDSRLLSVLTWYHISFMAVSLAMLGAAAGAVLVFLNFRRLEALGPPRALYLLTLVFALSIPATHLILKEVQIPTIIALTWKNTLPLASTVVILALPFLLSGAAITVGLTMVGGRIGFIYGADLLGASAGCLLIVPLLQHLDMASALFVVAALAAAGSACFARFHGGGRDRVLAGTAILLLALGLGHAWLGAPLEMSAEAHAMYTSKWNAYSHVLIGERTKGPPFYWGRGAVAEQPKLESIPMVIDRNAATPMTGWDGDPASLSWVQYDVTALPYHLRSGDVAIIGVGGGRDILAAIWGRSTSITAIEYNEIFVRLLRESHREFAQLADFEGVTLVNDEGRAYLTRSPERFDVIQMSLVDTMAATGAGAFTLTENGLYTVEAWRLFLDRLKPTGVLSTSRWFSPSKISETSRLLALCVTVQLERGARDPAEHIALITRGNVATLLTSPEPFTADDVKTMVELAGNLQFDVVAIPGQPPADLQLARILSSSSLEELRQAVAHPHFDLSAPTDRRPYFFNMLKFASLATIGELQDLAGPGVIWGNLRATATLGVLMLVSGCLIVLIILLPLARAGLPQMSLGSFLLSITYFAIIGYAFMAAQIPFLQRFSIFLGHPIYTYSVVLFAMICFSGIGSLISERIQPESRGWFYAIPGSIAVLLLTLSLSIGGIVREASQLGLVGRSMVVIGVMSPVSVLLGMCFPLGARMVSRLSDDAMPWMWGINGAFGVFASILSVAISIMAGIYVNLLISSALYLSLALVAGALRRRALAPS